MPKKILFIDPPFQKFMNFSKGGIPLGLLSLAGSLKERGHEVKVLDADYNPRGNAYPFIEKIEHYRDYLKGLNDETHPIWEDIRGLIQDSSPDVIGLSLISTKVKSGLKIAEIGKKLGVKRIVAGGPHVTIDSNGILKNKYIDSVVIGEAENVFEKSLVEKIVISDRIKDLDNLALPSRDSLINIEGYNSKDLGFVTASRGCVGSCNFCCSERLWDKKVRTREIKNVLEEIDLVNKKYGTTEFYLVDDTFTLSRKRVMEFGKGMKERGYRWSCLTRMDKVDKELIENMLDSNCQIIKVGVESGNESVLRSMNKNMNLNTIKRAAQIFNESGMPWLAYFIVGSPDETTENMYETMEFIEKIKPTYVSASIYTPYPGTGFTRNHPLDLDFAMEEANHHSLEVIAGKIPREELKKFMAFADKYNDHSSLAKKLFKR